MDIENEFFYHFRSTHALLDGWNELEKQEIYFASPDELNDPMEGFKDIFWSGDSIVWRNFIRHYLLCFMHKITFVLVSGEQYDPILARNIIFSSTINHPTSQFGELYEKICNAFFSESGVAEIPDLLAACKHRIRREELKFYLRALHSLATICILNILSQLGVLPMPARSEQLNNFGKITIEGLKRVLNESIKDHEDQERKLINILFQSAEQIISKLASRDIFSKPKRVVRYGRMPS